MATRTVVPRKVVEPRLLLDLSVEEAQELVNVAFANGVTNMSTVRGNNETVYQTIQLLIDTELVSDSEGAQ